jgi:hypothetical protein
MFKERLTGWMLTVTLVLLPVWLAMSIKITPPISQQTCDQIQLGMTEDQVEAIVGKRPNGIACSVDGRSYGRLWHKDGKCLTVGFENGRVTSKYFGPGP